jgi:predicted dehydrogenase
MRLGIIGCGYVIDHYLRSLRDHPDLTLVGVADRDQRRADAVATHHATRAYPSAAELIADPSVQLVVNLTTPQSHYAVTRAGLLAGKHVYSEKPLSLHVDQANELVELARSRNLMLSAAPCNTLAGSWQAVRAALASGVIGSARLVYAELDDNPIHLMRPEEWRSESGAPWPYRNEFEVGCTLEHAGYHLTALVALFGPVASLTAFSSCLVPNKTVVPLDPPDTPDFSIACLVFRSGVVARLTCSIVAPYDHRLRIVGEEGMITLDDCWQNQSSVHLERFSSVTLNARKVRAVRHSRLLQSLVGVGGRRQPVVPAQRPHATPVSRSVTQKLRQHELISMDFLLGIQDMHDALDQARAPTLPPELLLHVNEVELAIARAGAQGSTCSPVTTFEPLDVPRLRPLDGADLVPTQASLVGQAAEKVLARLHRHGSSPSHGRERSPTSDPRSTGPDLAEG